MNNPESLIDGLLQIGFEVVSPSNAGRWFKLDVVRTSTIEDLFEHVLIEGIRIGGEYGCSIDLSLSPVRLERSWFDVHQPLERVKLTSSAKKDVRSTLPETVPTQMAELVSKHGQVLLDLTSDARNAVQCYLRYLRELTNEREIDWLANQLESQAHDSQESLAKKLRSWCPGPGLGVALECAAYCIVLFGERVESDFAWIKAIIENNDRSYKEDSSPTHGLIMRMQMLADRLFE